MAQPPPSTCLPLQWSLPDRKDGWGWNLARSQCALTAAASGGIDWQAKLRLLRMVWTHRAGYWASLNCRKFLRQGRDSVKILYVLSSVRGGFETQNSIEQGRVVLVLSFLVISESVVVLKVPWTQEVHIQPPSPFPAPTHIYTYMCKNKKKKNIHKSSEETIFCRFAPQLHWGGLSSHKMSTGETRSCCVQFWSSQRAQLLLLHTFYRTVSEWDHSC